MSLAVRTGYRPLHANRFETTRGLRRETRSTSVVVSASDRKVDYALLIRMGELVSTLRAKVEKFEKSAQRRVDRFCEILDESIQEDEDGVPLGSKEFECKNLMD